MKVFAAANTAAYLRCPLSRGYEYDKVRKGPAPATPDTCVMCLVTRDFEYDKVRKAPLATAAPIECLDWECLMDCMMRRSV